MTAPVIVTPGASRTSSRPSKDSPASGAGLWDVATPSALIWSTTSVLPAVNVGVVSGSMFPSFRVDLLMPFSGPTPHAAASGTRSQPEGRLEGPLKRHGASSGLA